MKKKGDTNYSLISPVNNINPKMINKIKIILKKIEKNRSVF